MERPDHESQQLELLQDMFIFQLLQASVPQQAVRKIVKLDLKRVTRIGKLVKASRSQGDRQKPS
jgi:hypothetical protein